MYNQIYPGKYHTCVIKLQI